MIEFHLNATLGVSPYLQLVHQVRRALRLGHAGRLPLPPASFGQFEPPFDPHAQPVPADIAGVGRQIGEDQPGIGVALLPAGEQRVSLSGAYRA